MAKKDVTDELMELMIEKETIEATLEELKKAFESGDLNDEDYKESKDEYEEKLDSLQKDIVRTKKAKTPVEEPKLEAIEEEMSAKVEEATENQENEGIEGETLEPTLKSIEEEMSSKIRKVVEEPEAEIKEVEEVEEAPIEEIEEEIRALRRTYSVLNVKKEVSQSTLDIIKKNFEEGAIDESAYNRLKDKYENELNGYLVEIEEINKKIKSREAIIPKYKELFKIKSEYNSKIRALEKDITKNNRGLEFFKSRKLSIISNVIDYLSNILQEMKKEDENLRNGGIEVPATSTPKKYAKKIKENKEILAELKATQEVLPTILDNLERKRSSDEMDKETYLKMKSEYNAEKTKTNTEIKRVEEKMTRIEKELGIYNNMDKSKESCRFIANAMNDSFKKIWLEDQIEELESETTDLIKQKQKLENGLESKTKKMNQELDKLYGKIS